MVDNKKKVLLVDDEPFLLEALAEYLMEFDHEIYSVLTANNGREALEFLPRKDIGLIVSDIYMPEISGIQLLIRIKEKYPETGVILMSGYCSEQIRKEVDQNGCLFFIEKPFEFAQIRKLILENIANP